ncbi:hypothetical protein PSACC_02978 [Paramicrosporidium saccamoebae]|uniref:Uncharacterized protein n=1 Tax=Paramicrosporidium saccamoebae TaxID=1246581 RepID=A0A2H9THE5_9FUNG|nr:hypothetical protein PSACC_02978 [Paramicrosporidium saccamoebae]
MVVATKDHLDQIKQWTKSVVSPLGCLLLPFQSAQYCGASASRHTVLCSCRKFASLAAFALFYVYFPEAYKQGGTDDNPRPSSEWKTSLKALRIIVVYTLLICVISLLVVLVYNVPSFVATAWTALLAFIALISSLMAGALSIPAMMMQTPGSFLFCYTIAMSPGTNFTSWVTYFVGGCLQGILLVLCLYYQQTMPTEFILVQEDEDRTSSLIVSPNAQLLKLEFAEKGGVVGAA